MRWFGRIMLALVVVLLLGCGDDGGDADDSAATSTTEALDDDGTGGEDGTSTTSGTSATGGSGESGDGECPLTSEQVSAIIGSTVEEQPELRTGADCQYTGGGLHVVLGARSAGGLSPDEYLSGNEEALGLEAERVAGVGDGAAFLGDDSDLFLAFHDGQVISVLGAPTRDAAIELAQAVIEGL